MPAKAIKILSIFNLVIGVLLLPFAGVGFVMGLAGPTAGFVAISAFGYLGSLVVAVVCLFRPKVYKWLFVSYALIIAGILLDGFFWKNQNADLCKDLRSDPYCRKYNGYDPSWDCGPLSKHPGLMTSDRICD